MVSHLYNISFIFRTSPFMVDFIVYIRVIRDIRSSYHPLFSFVIMSFCLKKIICLHPSLCYSVSKKSSISICHYVILSSKKSSVSICHYVILSQKNHLSPFVIMSFCLKIIICLHLSLCYSVSKKSSVSVCHYVILSSRKSTISICHYVILSSKKHLSPFVIMSFCLQKSLCLRPSLCYSVSKKHLSSFVIMSFCLKNSLCLYLSLCYSVSHLFCLYRVEKS